MAVSRDQKKVLLSELTEQFGNASSVIFANYIGLKVSEVSALRKQLRAAGAEMKVGKKTLMRLAAEQNKLPMLEDKQFTGPVACIFSFEDPIAGAQVAFKFSKEHQQVAFLGGIFEKKLLSKADALTLATIPGRTALLGMFAGIINSPLVSFASMCSAPLTGFARAMQELGKKGGVSAKAA